MPQALQAYLSTDDIETLKQGYHQQKLLIILDGYDDLGSGQFPNLTESLQDWPYTKILITSRAEHFSEMNSPESSLCLHTERGTLNLQSLQTVHLSPFVLEEIKRYVMHYKPDNLETYATLEAIPGLMSLLDNPFLLTLLLQSLAFLLPRLQSQAVSRFLIYQAFYRHLASSRNLWAGIIS